MSQETQRHEMTLKKVVHRIPGVDDATIRRDVEYRTTDTGPLTLDVYYPPDSEGKGPFPVVVFVIGYSDVGARRMLGCSFKDMESFVSWGRLTAAGGMAAVAYATGADPAADADAVLEYVRKNAASLGLDGTRIGLWACSGHVPNALSVLMRAGRGALTCAAACYGYMLDLDGSTAVAEACKTFRFVNPVAGKSVEDLPSDTPLLVVRAGRDETPGLNESIDRFAAKALAVNLPMTLTNYPEGPHAFDIVDDTETTHVIVEQILTFMRLHLSA